MATYDNDLRLKEITTGDEDGTWGTSTNTNLELIGEALSYGTQDCFASDADATTTVADSATDPARSMYFKVTSSATLTATRTLTIAPNTISRVMWIENATTGGQSITISQGSGGTVTIPNGDVKVVYLDGAGAGAAVVDAFTDLNLADVSSLVATTVDINGGTIDGVTIGGASAGAGTFTTFTSTGIDDNATSEKLQIADTVIHAGTNLLVGDLTTTPDGTLHVHTATAGAITADGSADDGVFENSGNVGVSLLTADGNFSTLAFGSPTSNVGMQFYWNYTAGTGVYATGKVGATIALAPDNAVTNLTLSGASGSEQAVFEGNVGIGTSSPDAPLTVTEVSNVAYKMLKSSGSSLFTLGEDGSNNVVYSAAVAAKGHIFNVSAGTEALRIDGSGNVGIGTSSPSAKLDVDYGGNANKIKITNSGNARVELGTTGDEGEINLYRSSNTKFTYLSAYYSSYILNPFGLSMGKTDSTFGVAGMRIYTDSTYNGYTEAVTDGVTVMALNRLTSDGNLMAFYQASSLEGTISVSGSTVSYNGGHLARWTQMDSDNGSLLKGTVMTNLDDMCVWKQAVFTTQHLVSEAVEAVEAVAEIPEELDDEGNVIQEYVPAVEAVEAQDAVYEDVEQKETYEGDAADGDVIDFEFEGQTYSATVVFEDNEQLNKMEVSSVEGDANVAGVFVAYDDDGDIGIAMTGDMVIRIAQGTTVARGDLLMSAGDGTAKPQGDDIVRSKTIAKVTSTHVSHTYDDGSYLVPCVLMAC